VCLKTILCYFLSKFWKSYLPPPDPIRVKSVDRYNLGAATHCEAEEHECSSVGPGKALRREAEGGGSLSSSDRGLMAGGG
jgi:hypothetical protein